jgi:prophage antirepressor-like protein
MSDLVKFVPVSDGVNIASVFYDGRWCVPCAYMGRVLGYADDGGRLTSLITKDWRNEFEEGRDYFRIEGESLSKLKAEFDSLRDTSVVGSRAPSLILLTERGVNLVLIKTEKPVGLRVRAALAEEVMPALARGELVKREQVTRIESAAAMRERRLLAQLERDLVGDVAKETGVSGPAIGAWYARILGRLTGESVTALLPVKCELTYGAAEMAIEFGVTSQRIGLTITALDLRGNKPGLCEIVMDVAKHVAGKSVEGYRYTAKAKDMIRTKLIADGYLADDGSAATDVN